MSALPAGLRRNIRAFFSSYAAGCRQADDRLFRAGDADAVDDACRRSAVGKLLPNALYVHRTALAALDPLLRVYEGCARAKFERLTRQEERAGLLDDSATIGMRDGWAERLRERGYALRGHRLVRAEAGDGPTGGRSGDGSG